MNPIADLYFIAATEEAYARASYFRARDAHKVKKADKRYRRLMRAQRLTECARFYMYLADYPDYDSKPRLQKGKP